MQDRRANGTWRILGVLALICAVGLVIALFSPASQDPASSQNWLQQSIYRILKPLAA